MSTAFLSIVWDVNPNIFTIGSFEIRYYGLAWALTFAIGWYVFIKSAKDEGYSSKVSDSIFWFGVLSTIIGARLGHCFFYDAAYYFEHPIEILNIRDGGLASHGAAIGLLTGLWLFSKYNKMPYVWSLDRIMLPVTLGGGLVRLGNLMNSEIYGVATDKPWGFIFVNGHETVAKHPTQIYEALCYFVTFAVLAWLFYGRQKMGLKRPGLMFGVGLIGVFVSRFFIEYIKNPQEAFEENMSLMMGQWLSIPFVLLGIWMVYNALKRPAIETTSPQQRRATKAKQSKALAIDNVKSASSTTATNRTDVTPKKGKTKRAKKS